MHQQENSQIYYMVIDEKSTGPYTLDEIILHPKITPETLVWKPGIENWVAAKTLPELFPAFANNQQRSSQTPPEYNDQRRDTNNSSQNEENPGYNPFADNPQYQNNHYYHNPNQGYHNHNNGYYGNQQRYRNDYRPNFRTNWMPWAIVATIFGFFTSCIGAIFGIIGIVQANKANNLYSQGYDREGDAANSNAKIMTIIGLIFAGIGVLALVFFGNIFSGLSNLSYY